MSHDIRSGVPVRLNGAMVRRLRQRLHLTQKELAAVVWKYQPDISALECGRYVHVYPATLAALAQALGVAMEDLVGEEDREQRPG